MALVHEKLYQSSDLRNIDFKEYINDLGINLLQSYEIHSGNIKLNMNVEDILLDIDLAIPTGLIINELITNSLKYAFPDGMKGEINISFRSMSENMLELVVSDNGIGLPENLDFRKTRTLGLHLVTVLAENQLHGKIDINRIKGTEFRIQVQRDKIMTSATQILIVEDEIIIAEDIQIKLIRMGYSVPDIVSSGEEAIKKVKENNPDIILMDIVIHGNMDGIETVERIHAFSDVPVIYLTAYADQTTLERAKITEPFGYLLKPFKERELLITLEMAIYKHKMETKLKESQKKLRERERWLTAAIRSIGDGVIATDLTGSIKIMNPLAQALTGWNKEDALSKPLREIFNVKSQKDNKPVEDPVAKVIREGNFYGLSEQTILITKNKLEIPVDIIGSPITDDNNNIIGVVLVFYDIFERKEMEKKMRTGSISSPGKKV